LYDFLPVEAKVILPLKRATVMVTALLPEVDDLLQLADILLWAIK
jgi:hypothetical protein